MNFLSLDAFIKKVGSQRAAAQKLNCTQSYLSQSLKQHRSIWVSEDGSQTFEVRPYLNVRNTTLRDTIRLHEIGSRLAVAA